MTVLPKNLCKVPQKYLLPLPHCMTSHVNAPKKIKSHLYDQEMQNNGCY